MDANLLHISYEGRALEDPAQEPEEDMWRWTVSPEKAPDTGRNTSSSSTATATSSRSTAQQMSPGAGADRAERLGGKHGIGRLDLVENRYVGMKSRGCYETPGGTIMLKAHRAIESITLDREVAHLKDELMPRYASLIYNGYWWSPERRMLQQMIDASQASVNGWVRLKLYKGNVMVVGRDSQDRFAVRLQHRDVRGRSRRLQPDGRRGLHPAQALCACASRPSCGIGKRARIADPHSGAGK